MGYLLGMTETAKLTTKQVAERLGITTKRVWALIKAERLPSEQFGRDHLIKESDLALVADRKPGRPPKAKDKVADEPAVKEADKPATESEPEPKPTKAQKAPRSKPDKGKRK
jgi:excisionase family DNA binding protein